MSPDAVAAAATSILPARVPGLLAIYRFGSSGTVAERRDSDVDLAILTEPPLAEAERRRLRRETAEAVAARLSRDVDLIDLGSASTVFRARIVADGERIWCARWNDVERFEDYAFSAYARLNEERAGILQDIQRTGRIHGG